MDEPICLDEAEVKALRELIAMLSTMEERGFDRERPGFLVVSQQLWRDMILRPAQGLRRVTTPKLPR